MTDEELDAIVSAIGTESPVGWAIRFLSWLLPMVAACVPIAGGVRGGLPPSTRDWAASAVLFSTGVVVLAVQKLKRRQGR
jgi:hypothetical protein